MNATNKRLLACIVIIVIAIIVLVVSGASVVSKEPQIVVYLDKESRQPATLPLPESTPLTGERAALWWSVYNKALEKNYTSFEARNAASIAVETVYGKVK